MKVNRGLLVTIRLRCNQVLEAYLKNYFLPRYYALRGFEQKYIKFQLAVFKKNHCEQLGASSESKASFHILTGIQKTLNLGNYGIFRYCLWTQSMFLFDHIIKICNELARPGPTRPYHDITLFDGLFLSHLKINRF